MGALFWFILNFTGLVHCDHIVWQIAKNILNNLLKNTVGTFFGNFLNFPNNCLIGKLKSHGLVHCKSAEHILRWGYCREIGLEYSECTYNMPVRYVPSSLSQYSQCTKYVTAWYIALRPQCLTQIVAAERPTCEGLVPKSLLPLALCFQVSFIRPLIYLTELSNSLFPLGRREAIPHLQ